MQGKKIDNNEMKIIYVSEEVFEKNFRDIADKNCVNQK